MSAFERLQIVDDILFFPIKSILWIFKELYKAAYQELESEQESITTELSDLYMMLETGKITEAEFDAKEKELLDRLDALQEQEGVIEEDEEDEGEEA